MPAVKEIGSDIVKGVIDSRRKKSSSDTSDSSGVTGSGTGPNDASDSTSSSSSDATKKRSTASKIGGYAAQRLLSGGSKRSGGPLSQDYSVAGMGLAGPISDSEPDFLDGNGRGTKRSNGKTRG